MFDYIDTRMKDEQLYLDIDMNEEKLARIIGTNRTYISRAVATRYENFRDYLNTLRLENMRRYLSTHPVTALFCEDYDEFANRYGFRSRRSLDRVSRAKGRESYSKIRKKRFTLS
ncbi:MAG: hypothetical protein HUJ89_01240 [Bacteroidales bacterium]|nr:hypothetical protein [Bacteroidales bacterium]